MRWSFQYQVMSSSVMCPVHLMSFQEVLHKNVALHHLIVVLFLPGLMSFAEISLSRCVTIPSALFSKI